MVFCAYIGYVLKKLFKNKSDLLLIVIDQQKLFADPLYANGYGTPETQKAARNNMTLIDAFENAGADIVYVRNIDHHENGAVKNDYGGWYLVQPEEADWVFNKNQASAFWDTNFDSALAAAGKKRLVFCGFNASECVQETVVSAVRGRGFQGFVYKDGIANDKRYEPNEMTEALDYLENDMGVTLLRGCVI